MSAPMPAEAGRSSRESANAARPLFLEKQPAPTPGRIEARSRATVLITGASGGIGAAIARRMAVAGASLILNGRNEEQLLQLARSLGQQGADIRVHASDLSVTGAADRLVADAIDGGGTIETVINCAGIQNFGFFTGEATQDTERLFRINVLAPIALIHAVLPHMLERRTGQIVNMGSIFGSIAFPCFASYSASKFALRGFTEALRRELVGSGISVTYVAPRFTRTAFNGSAATRMASALRMSQDEPSDVARAVVAALDRRGGDSYLGWPEKLFVRINSLFPRLVDRSLMKQVEQMRPFTVEPAA